MLLDLLKALLQQALMLRRYIHTHTRAAADLYTRNAKLIYALAVERSIIKAALWAILQSRSGYMRGYAGTSFGQCFCEAAAASGEASGILLSILLSVVFKETGLCESLIDRECCTSIGFYVGRVCSRGN